MVDFTYPEEDTLNLRPTSQTSITPQASRSINTSTSILHPRERSIAENVSTDMSGITDNEWQECVNQPNDPEIHDFNKIEILVTL